jgi:hypothetical protein
MLCSKIPRTFAPFPGTRRREFSGPCGVIRIGWGRRRCHDPLAGQRSILRQGPHRGYRGGTEIPRMFAPFRKAVPACPCELAQPPDANLCVVAASTGFWMRSEIGATMVCARARSSMTRARGNVKGVNTIAHSIGGRFQDGAWVTLSAQTCLGGVLGGNLAFYTMLTSNTSL